VPKPVWENVSTAAASPTAEYQGFQWITRHTSPGAVLAVDDRKYPLSCFQTAFAQRRAMIDCYWGFAPEVSLQNVQDLKPYISASLLHQAETRVALDDAIFDRASPRALAQAYRNYGVRYVVVDLHTGGTPAEVARLAQRATPVFRNDAVVVFRLSAASA
jgi:hypothetical protein